ncbi:MAG: tRNA dimethylallyltransferase [Flavobacteriaceae bacterium]|jgi:tRNA dimethylallyltransferase|tara:strand:+ start:7133 stop:8041 length:909 start_codon:yes stop_codon:yes gene_type:complete
MYKYLISIVGPTAIGKTSLAIQLAEKYSTEIISADSRQFYREMNIGTAKPSVSELNSAKHHLINNKSVVDNYSIGEFEQDAIKQISNIHSRSNIAVLVGGSGLYLDVINYGLDQIPKTEKNIRNSLNNDFESKGLIYLQNKLKKIDLITYNNIDLNNSRRIIRALEVTISSGKPYSSFLNKKKVDRDFKVIEIGINAERELVYQRINNRVDDMVNQGLINEVKKLIKYKHLNSLNTIGYKEIFRYLNGDISLEFAVNEIKKNSRRFAKRQITWFKSNNNIIWFNQNYKIDNIIKVIDELISN